MLCIHRQFFFIKSAQPVLVLYVLFKNLISLSFFAVLCCTIWRSHIPKSRRWQTIHQSQWFSSWTSCRYLFCYIARCLQTIPPYVHSPWAFSLSALLWLSRFFPWAVNYSCVFSLLCLVCLCDFYLFYVAKIIEKTLLCKCVFCWNGMSCCIWWLIGSFLCFFGK